MKNIFAILLLTGFTHTLFAQFPLDSLLKSGNTWMVKELYTGILGDQNPLTSIHSMAVLSDTVINAETYQSIYYKQEVWASVPEVAGTSYDTLFFRQTDTSLVEIDTETLEERVRFYFSGTGMGDTIFTFQTEDHSEYNPNKYAISKVDTILFGQIERRVFYMYKGVDTSAYVDGVGFVQGGLLSIAGPQFDEYFTELQCATIDGYSFYTAEEIYPFRTLEVRSETPDLSSKCFTILGTRPKNIETAEYIMKTDEYGNIILDGPKNRIATVWVYDLKGNKVAEVNDAPPLLIETHHLNSGMFLFKLTDDTGGVFSGKFIK
jgi:hypothetical protein